MSHYPTDGSMAVTPVALSVGDRVRLDGRTKTWLVQAVSPNFAALVQQVPFQPKGSLQYTVLDWRNGVRGPCDLIGQGYGDGSYSESQCADMLLDFEDLSGVRAESGTRLSVSQRNWMPIGLVDVVVSAKVLA